MAYHAWTLILATAYNGWLNKLKIYAFTNLFYADIVYICIDVFFSCYLFPLNFFSGCQHKFFEKWKSGSAAMLPKLEKARQMRASMALQVQTHAPAASGNRVWLNLAPPSHPSRFACSFLHRHANIHKRMHIYSDLFFTFTF